ncbi:YeeE/YedE thiosulfate transporter family protein [Congregibacter sp.]|uniref:YeeE/YedE thiosulfate transporter family protein n=1 Tax=Congregibacter sp. TaxID=2744308 RepID=UPI003F6B4BCF
MAAEFPVTPSTGKSYWNPYFGGMMLGVVLFLAYLITGSGLGASGGMNRLLVWVQDALMPAHVDQVPYLLKMAGGELNPLKNWIVYLTLGTIAGGFVSGLLSGRTHLETNKGPQVSNGLRWVLAFAGGALMGYGARLARGCTSGQILSGGAVMSTGSWLMMIAVFGGAYLLAYSFRKIWN